MYCVFHSIRFKVNKGWSSAELLFLCPYVKGCFLTVLLLVYLLLGDDNDVFSKKIVDTFDFSYFSLGRFILFRVTCAVSLWENICLFRDGKVEKFPAC